ncbi:M1 family metallopeptidase [Stackebrandtia nassauensis]|uniref:Peptidase M1 membrane alanine aminopeptidase n=1 Tax=Stackebrandtia nassauensis (strain DSM 44728 / CIP 108903 / NRRL B-16338 / NBRC 102104 / LLR-40K-21) TaxID=446470 RepID=D3Q4H4_STANL|nr:M1 family metallopeptidase [Stackebrandtia nassauensis]ADD40134.1 Peptidase M1 membrane alanine aminopeptidase [Stackebrandtia nassauensis DSM 44728]
MKKRFLLLAGVLAASVAAVGPAQAAEPDEPVTPQDAKYLLSLDSDATGANWSGTQTVTFRNKSDRTMDTLWIRLWGNGRGGCDDRAVSIEPRFGGELGAETVDCTAVPIELTRPVPAGRTGMVSVDVDIAVPEETYRFGRAGDYRFIGNAIPVLAVHDGTGELPPFTSFGESFYTLESDFLVTLDHPNAVKVPATGRSIAEVKHGKNTTTVIKANNVRDFAWAAGPFAKVDTVSATGAKLRTWYPGDIDKAKAEEVTGWVKEGMDTFDAAYGEYPYSEMDTVIGDWEGFAGMEYPGFILTEPAKVPAVHEAGHQWFYGLVGNDQYNDPWLDESVTQYMTNTITGVPGYCATAPFWFSDGMRIDAGMDYYNEHIEDEYAPAIYGDGACMLAELETTIGKPAMDEALRTAVAEFSGGVITSDELRGIFAEVSGQDLSAFWERWRNTGA